MPAYQEAIDKLLYSDLSYQVIGSAMEVHNCLGSGFLEAVYQRALESEFKLRGIVYQAQKALVVEYKGVPVGEFCADFVVEEKVVVEIKAASKISPVHEAQAHNYLAATGLQLAILLNFGAPRLEHKRIIRTKKLTQI